MSRFGWAYVSSVLLSTGTVANGPTGSLQFHNSSQALSGSPNLTYNVSSGQLVLTGTMIVSGTLYATEYHTNIVSSSIIYSSGSTKFGDDAADTHQFTGSVLGDVVSGTIARFTTISGSNITGTFVGNGTGLTALTASNITNFTSDVRGQFSAGTGIAINAGVISASNVPNSSLQYSSVALGTTSISLGSTGSIIQGLTALTASTVTGTTAEFTVVSGSIITSSNFVGNGISLTNITASNITNFTNDVRNQFSAGTGIAINSGVISASNVPNSSLEYSSLTIGTTSISLGATGSIIQGLTTLTSSNVTGTTAQFTTISGSVISSSNFVGNGSNITNITASNINNFTNDVRAQFTQGANITIVGGVISSTGGGTPGGADTQVQFNSGSTFSGSSNLTYNYTTNILSGTTAQFTTISASLLSASSIAGYVIGTNIQAYDATLAAVAGASTAADTYIYFTATDTAAVGTVTSFARTLLDDTNNTTARTTLGLGTIATQDATSIAITGGSINNTTIGATTQNTGQFTTLSASSTIRAGGAITGSGISSSAELLVGSTSTFAGTATFNGNVVLGDTISDVVTSNAQITASNGISGSTSQFTVVSGSTITSSNFVGNGINITNITSSNITNFTNDVRAQFTPGTNITIVGGVISSTGGGGGGTPGGADTQVQFNSGSTFSGSSNLTYNYTTNTLSGTTAQFTTLSASYISSSIVTFDVNTYDPAPTFRTGQLFVNPSTTAFPGLAYNTDITDVTLNVGQQNILRVKNSSGNQINKGKLVFVSGGVGDNPLIYTASWDTDTTSARTIGMVMANIANGDNGYVILNGVITNVNTAAYLGGTTLYLSSSGDYTGTRPTQPLHGVRIGEVVTSHATVGSIFVNIQNGFEVEELHDVLVTTPSNGDLFIYDGSSSLWKNGKALSGSYTITNNLNVAGTSSLAYFDVSGTYVYNDVTPVSSLAYTNKSASVASQDIQPRSVFFNPNGTKMYVIGDTGNDINQYTLSTAWDVSTATFFGVSSAFTSATWVGLYITPNGQYVFINNNTDKKIYRYTLTNPWQITSLNLASSITSSTFSNLSSISFKTDGLRAYVSNLTNNEIYQCNLTTAWDIQLTSLTIAHTASTLTTDSPAGINVSLDGRKIYTCTSGETIDLFADYNLTIPWELNTIQKAGTYSIDAQMTGSNGLYVSPNTQYIYGVDSSPDVIFQYEKTPIIQDINGDLNINGNLNLRGSAISDFYIDGVLYSSAGAVLAGGAGQNVTVSTGLVVSGPTPTFSNPITASGGILVTSSNGIVLTNSPFSFNYLNVTTNYTMTTASCIVGVSASTAVTLTLPSASAVDAGRYFIIKDEAGNSTTNNITISCSAGSGDTIDNLSSSVINVNNGSYTIYRGGANRYYIV